MAQDKKKKKCESCGKVNKLYLVKTDKNLSEFWCDNCIQEEETICLKQVEKFIKQKKPKKQLDCYGVIPNKRGNQQGKINHIAPSFDMNKW